MQYMSVKEAAQWGVTIQMVRRYCQKGMIPQVIQENGGPLAGLLLSEEVEVGEVDGLPQNYDRGRENYNFYVEALL